MPMTIVVTRNVEGRVRGFLASTMLEIASGVFTAPNLTPAVRDRIWAVLDKWRVGTRNDSAVMTWPDPQAPGGQVVRTLGELPLELHETPSVVLARRPLSQAETCSLTIMLSDPPF
jgi:CRISPR-associated protein Cas2